MPVSVDPTPNPNALKFTVGVDVGGPKTFVPGGADRDPTADALLALPGVTSVFMTADFVTLTKSPDAAWDEIVPAASAILGEAFGA